MQEVFLFSFSVLTFSIFKHRFFVCFLFAFWDRVLLCGSGWPWTPGDPPVSVSQVLELYSPAPLSLAKQSFFFFFNPSSTELGHTSEFSSSVSYRCSSGRLQKGEGAFVSCNFISVPAANKKPTLKKGQCTYWMHVILFIFRPTLKASNITFSLKGWLIWLMFQAVTKHRSQSLHIPRS